ncbi:MAG: T9SS type A sorting domain-containing protein [Chitinophagales bacterium]
MKKIAITLFFYSLFLIAFAQSPIILTVDDIANVDQEFFVGTAGPLTEFDGSDTGPDHTWNFSTLTAVTHDTSQWVDVTDTDPLYFFLWFGADVAEQTGAPIANDFITIEDVFNFYKRESDEFAITGFAGTISGIPLPIGYNDPETILEFPASYEDVTSSETGFDIEIPGLATWKEHRSRTNEVDGWGTLLIPSGEFEVLRVRSEIFIIDTFIYDVVEIPIEYTAVEYRWYSKLNGIPLLQINAIETLGIETTTQVFYKEGYVVNAIEVPYGNTAWLNIFQNNTSENLSININTTLPGRYSLELIDLSGRLVYDNERFLNSGENNLNLNIENLTGGLYLLALKQNNIILTTEKFIKQN